MLACFWSDRYEEHVQSTYVVLPLVEPAVCVGGAKILSLFTFMLILCVAGLVWEPFYFKLLVNLSFLSRWFNSGYTALSLISSLYIASVKGALSRMTRASARSS
jgi:hypothetical protein